MDILLIDIDSLNLCSRYIPLAFLLSPDHHSRFVIAACQSFLILMTIKKNFMLN